MSVQQRRKYDPDFKRNAVLLSEVEDRTVTEVAENLGISKDLLYRWRREYSFRENLAFLRHGRESLTEQESRIRELEKELQYTRMERDILKKGHDHLQQSTEMKYKFIEEHRSEFTVKKMPPAMGVSQSGYYRWLRKPISRRKKEKQLLQKIIKNLFARHKGMAGIPMIAAVLRVFPEYSNVSRQRVVRL